MKSISRINHIGIRVTHFQQSSEFYAKLGFEVIAAPAGPEPVAIMEHPCGININFIINANQVDDCNVLMDVTNKHTGYTHVALEIGNAEQAITELAALNIPLTGDMQHSNGRSLFIRDPDRNVVEFYAPQVQRR